MTTAQQDKVVVSTYVEGDLRDEVSTSLSAYSVPKRGTHDPERSPPATATVFNIAMAWNVDSGTSMATPHVSGVAALVYGKDASLTPDQVETILGRTATDLGVPNYDTRYGWGLVNAQAALAATP